MEDASEAPRKIMVAVRDDGGEWELSDALEFTHPWPGHDERRVYILPKNETPDSPGPLAR